MPDTIRVSAARAKAGREGLGAVCGFNQGAERRCFQMRPWRPPIRANIVGMVEFHCVELRAAFCLTGLALAAGIVGAAVGSRGLNACFSHSSIMTDSREPL
jgi:hypothetical protein